MGTAKARKKRVLAALKSCFQDRGVDTKDNVRRRIEQHAHLPEIAGVIADFGIDDVAFVACNLAKQGMFKSSGDDSQAATTSLQPLVGATVRKNNPLGSTPAIAHSAISVPEAESNKNIYSDSKKPSATVGQPIENANVETACPADVKKEGKKAELTASETESIQRQMPVPIVENSQLARLQDDNGFGQLSVRGEHANIGVKSTCPSDSKQKTLTAAGSLSNLTANRLTFETQHAMMCRLQRLLENSLYNFGLLKMSDVLRNAGWDCAQRVELHEWTKLLRQHPSTLCNAVRSRLQQPLDTLLLSVAQIRHTAVHRFDITIEELSVFLADAETLGHMIDDRECISEISLLRGEVSHAAKAIAVSKSAAQKRLKAIDVEMQLERKKLQEKEHAAVQKVLREARDLNRDASSGIQRLLSSHELATCAVQNVLATASTTAIGHTQHRQALRAHLLRMCEI